MRKRSVEVCLTPAIYHRYENPEAIVVVIDVLRATSAITTAFANGAEKIIPAGTVEEARSYKERGFLIAAERDGNVLDFADFGNSPFNFTKEKVKGKTIVYSTTNGTQTVQKAESAAQVLIGSFLNLQALIQYLKNSGRDILLLCAGWKGKVNLEDTLCAGALAYALLMEEEFDTNDDAVHIAVDLWKQARPDLLRYVDKAAQRSRLREKGLDDCIPWCHRIDVCDVIPVYVDKEIVSFNAVKHGLAALQS